FGKCAGGHPGVGKRTVRRGYPPRSWGNRVRFPRVASRGETNRGVGDTRGRVSLTRGFDGLLFTGHGTVTCILPKHFLSTWPTPFTESLSSCSRGKKRYATEGFFENRPALSFIEWGTGMRYWAECGTFIRECRQHFRNTGSLLPSSRFLARA